MEGVSEDADSYGTVNSDLEAEPSLAPSSPLSDRWKCCGSDYPRREIVFLTQVLAVYMVVVAAIYNLTAGTERTDRELWIALLSSALGYMLPGPALDPAKTSPTVGGQ